MMSCRRPICAEKLETRRLYAAATAALSSLPGLFDAVQPASHPALPAYFDTFSPGLSSDGPAAGTPAIAEWTRTAGPDQSIALTANQLGTADQTSAVVFGETGARNATFSAATIGAVEGQSASVTLGKDLPTNSMYLLWLASANGFGSAVALNRAEAWWVGPDAAPAGGSVSIYGRNLTLGQERSRAAVYLEPGPGNSASPRWLTVTQANPYQLKVALPRDLAAGNWQLWVHNGHGGEFGWSAPVPVTVTTPSGWNGQVFNVRRYGAKGDGRTDDQAAIRATVDAAESIPGSTVFFPAGKYLVNGGLAGLHDTRLLGQGMGATTIMAGPAFQVTRGGDMTGEALIYNPSQNVELANLGLSANGNMAGSTGFLVWARQSTDIRFTNVRFDARGYHPADIHQSHRITFSGCQIIGQEIFLGTASQVTFDACRLFMTNDSLAAMYTYGSQELSLTRNVVQNLNATNPNDGSGWGLGRFLAGNGLWGSTANVFLGANRTVALGVRSGYPNSNVGEQVAWEATQTFFDGQASAATPNSVSLANYTPTAAPPDSESTVLIVGGTGAGQTRTVSSITTDGIVTLTAAWNVLPDATSRVVIDTLPHNIAVYGNAFGGRPDIYLNSTHNASTGIEMFAGGANVIVDHNIFRMVRLDVNLSSGDTTATSTHVDPVFFTYVANNLFAQARYGVVWYRGESDAGISFLGNIVRANTNWSIVQNALQVNTASNWASLPPTPDLNSIDGIFTGGASGALLLDPASIAAGGLLVVNRAVRPARA